MDVIFELLYLVPESLYLIEVVTLDVHVFTEHDIIQRIKVMRVEEHHYLFKRHVRL